MSLITSTELVFWLPIMAVLNRLSGVTNASWLPGRNIYYTSLVTGLAGWFFVSPLFGGLAMLSMLAYRLPGWYKALDIGRDEGLPMEEFIIMCARHMYLGIPFAIFAVSTPAQDVLAILAATFCMGVLGGTAYALAFHSPVLKEQRDNAQTAELLAGAFIGVFFAAISTGG